MTAAVVPDCSSTRKTPAACFARVFLSDFISAWVQFPLSLWFVRGKGGMSLYGKEQGKGTTRGLDWLGVDNWYGMLFGTPLAVGSLCNALYLRKKKAATVLSLVIQPSVCVFFALEYRCRFLTNCNDEILFRPYAQWTIGLCFPPLRGY